MPRPVRGPWAEASQSVVGLDICITIASCSPLGTIRGHSWTPAQTCQAKASEGHPWRHTCQTSACTPLGVKVREGHSFPGGRSADRAKPRAPTCSRCCKVSTNPQGANVPSWGVNLEGTRPVFHQICLCFDKTRNAARYHSGTLTLISFHSLGCAKKYHACIVQIGLTPYWDFLCLPETLQKCCRCQQSGIGGRPPSSASRGCGSQAPEDTTARALLDPHGDDGRVMSS